MLPMGENMDRGNVRCVVVGLAAAVLGAGCNITEPYACTASVEPGIVVEIVDAQTGDPIAASARGLVRDGLFEDSLAPYRFNGEMVMVARRAADEREGTYSVFVSHPDYDLWAREGVRVRDGGCHVETVTLRAELERAAEGGDVRLPGDG